MKTVFLVKRFYTNKDLIEERFGRLFHLPTLLASRGHECSVLALDYETDRGLDRVIENVRFQSLPSRTPLQMASAWRKVRAAAGSGTDAVFSSGDSYIGYLGLRLAKRLAAKAVFDLYDDYASFGTNRIPMMKSLLRTAASSSDLLCCASQPILEKYRQYQENTLLLPNGVDTAVFRQSDRVSARQETGIGNNVTVIGYFGSIHKLRGIDDLLAAVAHLRADGLDCRLLLAGRDYDEVDLDHPWIDYRGMVSQEEIVALINSCDVVTVPYKDVDIIRMTNACKLMEYFSCGVPVVVTDVSDYASYFSKQSPAVARPSNPKSLADAIAWQLEHSVLPDKGDVLTWNRLAETLDERMRALL